MIHLILQAYVPEQILKVLDTKFSDDSPLFVPLKKFPESFPDKKRYRSLHFALLNFPFLLLFLLNVCINYINSKMSNQCSVKLYYIVVDNWSYQ